MDANGRRIRPTAPMKKPAAAEKKQEVLKRPAKKTPEPALKRQKSFYDDGDATKAKKQKAESEEESEDEEDEEEGEEGEEESEDEEAESTEESDNQEGDEEEELEEEDGLGGGDESEFGSDATTLILGGEENERIVASEDDPANFVTMESAWEDGEKRIMKLT